MTTLDIIGWENRETMSGFKGNARTLYYVIAISQYLAWKTMGLRNFKFAFDDTFHSDDSVKTV